MIQYSTYLWRARRGRLQACSLTADLCVWGEAKACKILTVSGAAGPRSPECLRDGKMPMHATVHSRRAPKTPGRPYIAAVRSLATDCETCAKRLAAYLVDSLVDRPVQPAVAERTLAAWTSEERTSSDGQPTFGWMDRPDLRDRIVKSRVDANFADSAALAISGVVSVSVAAVVVAAMLTRGAIVYTPHNQGNPYIV
jgi:hypothetical protein